MIEVLVGSDLVRNTDALHIEDLSAGQLVCVLNGALTNLLVANSIIYRVLDSRIVLSGTIVVISLVSVLVTLCQSRVRKALQSLNSNVLLFFYCVYRYKPFSSFTY